MTVRDFDVIKENNFVILQEDIKEMRSILRAYPPFVGLGTDALCNLCCVMCIQRLSDNKDLASCPPIEEKYLIKFAEQVFPTAKILQLNTAGEPLMSRTLDLELELAERYGVKVEVITNGTLLNSKDGGFEKLVRNVFSIQFSFDSPVKGTYESIRRGADFSQVVENMKLYKIFRLNMPVDQRPHFYIGMVLMKRNLHELPLMIKFAKDMEVDSLSISRIWVHAQEMKIEALENYKEEVNQVLSDSVELAKSLNVNLGIPPFFGINPLISQDKTENINLSQQASQEKLLKRCSFLWERVYIDSSANILTCCEPSHPVAGSIKENNFSQIWNNHIYQSMRRTFGEGPPHVLCGTCATSGYLVGCA